ncbi:MAG: hypothetical protein CSA09_02540 [Candidatus Contendobacter odensis]|uniref:Uncharacterized protein n=1 Tax=Candidatus Contendibacter odensensis TaxID=1400860 RepID=A0A2G6PFM0_9GAMM|nr:MAG: hypothetical protein CSA09_02540 [Candidatus Contendobacter odensis]
MKTWHILLALMVLIIITFMQPLVTFLGSLALLLATGAFIFRDLPPNQQEVIEQRVLGWLHRVRGNTRPTALPRSNQPYTSDQPPTKRARRTKKNNTKDSRTINDIPPSTPASSTLSSNESTSPTHG